MLSVNPHPPTTGREKGEKGRETYKLNIKTPLQIILIILRKNKTKYTKRILNFPELGAGALAFCQQLRGSNRNSETGPGSRRGLD